MRTLYLDHNATTPCDPRVVEAMAPFFSEVFGNPASRQHGPGRSAFMALEKARRTVAEAIGAQSSTEIIFTSGATEANNLAIKGLSGHHAGTPLRLVTQSTEHPAVLEPLRRLEAQGAELTVVGVDDQGRVDPEEIRRSLGDSTRLVSIMFANNETGVVQPIRKIVEIAHAHRALVHCDAAQAVGKLPVDLVSLGIDLMSISGHKLYGPKGIGALYVRRTTPPLRLEPLVEGGGHEGGFRSGTANVPGAVGLARALDLAVSDLADESSRLEQLRDSFEAELTLKLAGTIINGRNSPRLPGSSNLAFPGVDGEALMASLPDLALSTGSACSSVHPEPSKVLRAMGLSKKLASSAIRISFGRPNQQSDGETAATRIIEEVRRLRRKR